MRPTDATGGEEAGGEPLRRRVGGREGSLDRKGAGEGVGERAVEVAEALRCVGGEGANAASHVKLRGVGGVGGACWWV